MKYFSYELGTQINKNTLKGVFTKIEVNNILHKYIQEFILCSLCSLPSTSYKIRKYKIKIICSACGQETNKLTDEHKLVSYIQKNKINKTITM
jgi:translation initiation factor 2 beta subunit (eIF-2beta)/eIF-5